MGLFTTPEGPSDRGRRFESSTLETDLIVKRPSAQFGFDYVWDVDSNMSDEQAIQRVLVRYATAVDTRDWELLRSCFTEDAHCDYGDVGKWSSAEEICQFMDAAHIGFGSTNHMLSNFAIDVDANGETARSRAYVHAVLALLGDSGVWFDVVGGYEDVLIRTSQGWQISERTFRTTRMISGKDGS
jgi:SnoaL-like domain